MNEEEINQKLRELILEINSLPTDKKKKLEPLIEETTKRHEDIKKNFSKITDSFENLRICLKYILFDLEATKRERDLYKNQLDNRSSQDAEGEM